MELNYLSEADLKKFVKNILCISAFVILFIADAIAKEKKELTAKDSLAIESLYRFSLEAGGFLASLSSGLLFGSRELGLGINLNLEEALGLQTSEFVFRSEAAYKFGRRRRHNARLTYYGFYRKATKVLETDIEIGNEIYPIGTEISSKFNLQIFKASYDYSFFMDKRIELGVSLGLFVMPVGFFIASGGESENNTSFTAPLPVAGIRTRYSITPKFTLRQNLHLFYLKTGNYKGSLTDINIRLDYNPWKHFGFGLGYNSYHLNIISKYDDFPLMDFAGTISMDYTGILFFVKCSF